jgi:hypothetical protein
MDFTFGIITTKTGNDLTDIIKSIYKQNIDNYEIIIVGGNDIHFDKVKHIPFNETVKHGWITKKKNIITENSKFENIVFLHDYLILDDNWYNGQILSGNEFNIRVDIILNKDGSRFRDWCLWPDNTTKYGYSTEEIIKEYALLPYEVKNLNRFQYISGCYWIAKKHVMVKHPLNESLSWGESEDVEWSKRVREMYEISININSKVLLKKQKPVVFNYTTTEILKKLTDLI